MFRAYNVIALLTIAFGCNQTPKSFSPRFDTQQAVGELRAKEINEASGLVMSINNPGKLWTHNDSGDKARMFLIDSTGAKLTTIYLKNSKNRDWEDITIGAGPVDSLNYVYIGEIGDNLAVHDYKYIYRIQEPTISATTIDTIVNEVFTIKFALSDGARDAEALMIDHPTKDLYIFSKREDKIGLYKLSYPQTEDMVAEFVLRMPFTQIVAADMSADGNEVIIKSYDYIYYWQRQNNESVVEMLKRTPELIQYKPEPQGESIAFHRNGSGFYTVSEKVKEKNPVIYFYKRK